MIATQDVVRIPETETKPTPPFEYKQIRDALRNWHQSGDLQIKLYISVAMHELELLDPAQCKLITMRYFERIPATQLAYDVLYVELPTAYQRIARAIETLMTIINNMVGLRCPHCEVMLGC